MSGEVSSNPGKGLFGGEIIGQFSKTNINNPENNTSIVFYKDERKKEKKKKKIQINCWILQLVSAGSIASKTN